MRTRTPLKRIAIFLPLFIALSSLNVSSAELTASQRQERVKSGFQKGKTLYDAGRYDEAFAEWDAITPYLEPGSSVQKVVDFLKKRSGRAAAVQPIQPAPKVAKAAPEEIAAPPASPAPPPAPAPSAETEKPVLSEAPSELPALLERTSSKIDQEAKEAEARRALARDAETERRARADAAVEKGRTLYDAGRVDEALDVWEGVASEYRDGENLKKLIADVRRSQERLNGATASPSAAPAPSAAADLSELSDLLKEAGRRLDRDIAAAEAGRATEEKSSRRRLEEARSTADAFRKGKIEYEAGRYAEALAAWEGLRGSGQAPPAVGNMLDDLKVRIDKLERARQAAAAAPPAAVSGRGPSAEEMQRFFDGAAQRFDSEYSLAVASKRRVETGTAGGRAAVSEGFEKGRLLYYQGLYDEALSEWEAILPQIEEGSALRKTIQGLRDKRQKMRDAENEARNLSATASAKPSMPPELPKLLEQADKKLQNEIWQLQSAKTQILEKQQGRQAEIRRRAAEARELFDKGRAAEAIQRWEELLPLLDDPAALRGRLAALKLQAGNAALLKKTVDDLEASRKSEPFSADEIVAYVEQAKKRLDEETLLRETERKRLEREVSDRQQAVDAAFESGKKLYTLGKYEQAIDAWDKLRPYLDTETRERLESVKAAFESADRARREAETASASTDSVRVPKDFGGVLDRAEQELAARQAEAKKKKAEAEKEFETRQGVTLSAFEKGKSLFAEGRYPEAVREWEKLSVYDPRFAPRVEALQRAAAETAAAKAEAERLSAEGQGRLQASAEQMDAAMSEAAAQMRAAAAATAEKKTASQQSLESRRSQMQSTFDKGKAYFAAGRYEEAAAEWEKLSAADKRFAPRVEALQRAAADAAAARAEADRLTAEARSRVQASAEQMDAALVKASDQLKAAAAAAAEQKTASEKDLQSRQSALQAAFDKGKALFESGRYEEAAAAWEKLSAVDPRFAPRVEALQSAATAASSAKAEVDHLFAESQGRLKVSADQMDAALTEAAAQMQATVADAQSQRAAGEKDFQARQTQLQAAFESGKTLFSSGRYEEAAAAWEKLGAVDRRFGPRAQALKRAAAESAAARLAAEQFKAERDAKIKEVSEQMGGALAAAERDIRTEAARASERKTASEKDLQSRQSALQAAFDKGKALFESGRYEEAAAEWQKLAETDKAFAPRVETLKRAAAESAAARRAAEQYTTESYGRMKVSAEQMSGALAAAEEEIHAETAKASEQKSQMEKGVAERQAFVRSTFEEGRKLYAAGKREEALNLWETITPYLQDEAVVKGSLKRVTQALEAAREAARRAEEAAGRQNERFKAPEDLTKLLAEAQAAIEADTRKSESALALSQKTLADRRAAVETALAAAREDYEAGRYEQALKGWNAALPSLEEERDLKPAVDRVSSSALQRDRAVQALSAVQAKKESRFKAPQELAPLLDQASRKMNGEAETAASRAKEIEGELADRQVWITFTFQDGRKLYEAGKYDEALKVWDSLVPYLENGAEIRAMLEQIRKDKDTNAQALKAASDAAAKKEAKFRAPAALPDLLQELSARLGKETAASKAAAARSQETVSQLQAAADASFGRGKTAYTAGLYEEALKEWEAALPYYEGAPELAAKIKETREKLGQALEAKRQADLAAANGEVKLKAPADLPKLLAETDAKILQDKKSAEEEKAKLEKARADRQAWIEATFLAGRDAYAQGKYHEALAAWDKIAVYLDPQAGIREALDRVRKTHDESLEAKKSVVQFAAKEFKETRVPEGMEALLKEADGRLKDDVRRFEFQKNEAQKSLSERIERLRAASERGKAHYQAGRLAEAVREWQSMTADLDSGAPEAKLIGSLVEGAAARAAAEKSASESIARKTAPLSLPEGSLTALNEAQKKLYSEASQYLLQKEEAEKALASRKTAVAAAGEKAKTLLSEGKIEAALAEWEKLAPQYAEGPALQAAIQKTREALAETASARAAAADATKGQEKRLPAPEGLPALLEQTRLVLKKEAIALQAQAKKTLEIRANLETRVAASLEKAKTLAQTGKIEDAIREWAAVLPLLESSPAVEDSFRGLRAAMDENTAARQALDQAAQAEKRKISLGPDFAATLETAAAKLKEESLAAQNQRAQMEKALADRRAWANSVYQKGRSLYAEGKYADAITQWEELLSKSEEASALKPALDKLKAAQAEAAAARKGTDDFAASEYKQLKLPLDELGKLLQDADAKLLDQTRRAEADKAEMQKTLAERQAWVADTFGKGKALYADGRIREALDIWSTLTPYLVEEGKMKEAIARTLAKNEQAVDARRQADAAAQNQQAKLKTPEELTQVLTEADQKLLAVIKSANDQKALADKAVEDKKVWVRFTFEDGKNLYAAGKTAEALQLWSTLVPQVEGGEAIKESLQKVSQSLAESVRARQAASEAIARQDQKFTVPEEMKTLLEEAQGKLLQDTASSQAQKGKADQITAERQQWIEKAFADGRQFYQQGRIPEAIKEWIAIVPYLEGESELKAQMEKVSELHSEAESARAAAAEAASKEVLRAEAPPELYKLLEEATQSLRQDTEKAIVQREESKKSLEQRQAAVTESFQRGRANFEAGRTAEAIEEWRSMLPHLAEGEKIEPMLASLGEGLAAAEKAKTEAKDALSRQNVKLEMPAELFPLLERANESLKAEAFEAQAQKTKAEGSLQDRQQWIVATFQRGKGFYDQGLYKEAVDEWAKLAPYTDEASGIRELIESVRQSQKATLEAKTAAVEAVAGEYKGMRLAYTDQMVQLLDKANKKLKEEAESSLKKKEETEAAMAERKEWSMTTFNKGKIFYEQGRFDEAIDQWSRLIPYLEGDSRARQLIETIKSNHDAYLAAEREAEASSGQKPDYAAMAAFFEQAASKLATETQEAKVKTVDAMKTMAKRKEWIETTFQKGKDLYDQGRYGEALNQWDILKPYLSESPELQKAVDEARRRADEAAKTVPQAAQVAALTQKLPPLPEQPAAQASPARPEEASEAAEPQEETIAQPSDENSQFVSGEVTAVDSAEKTLTMKLYTVNKEKNLKIHFDNSTKIDGGAQDVNALASGTAIDLRYDPQTNKALYIYIY